jgi:hypothetical protein
MNIIEKKIKHNILLDDDDTSNDTNNSSNNVTEVANTDMSSKFEAKPKPKYQIILSYIKTWSIVWSNCSG